MGIKLGIGHEAFTESLIERPIELALYIAHMITDYHQFASVPATPGKYKRTLVH